MEKEYTKEEVCKKLNISVDTLKKWYVLETLRLRDEPNTESRLPAHRYREHMRGKPVYYTESDVKALQQFREKYMIVGGRRGSYGKYTNPNYTKKEEK